MCRTGSAHSERLECSTQAALLFLHRCWETRQKRPPSPVRAPSYSTADCMEQSVLICMRFIRWNEMVMPVANISGAAIPGALLRAPLAAAPSCSGAP
eukprot:309728-Rhodomonas_salina.2